MIRKRFNSSYGGVSYLERTGERPVIFLHGLGGTGNSWMKLSQHLSDGLRLFFFDMLGHGRSARPEIEYTIDVQEDVLEEFVTDQGLENVSLMGNSYGGWVAARFSIDRMAPTHLILEDSAGINMTVGELGEDLRAQFVRMVVRSNSMNTEAVIGNISKNNSSSEWKLKEEELKELKPKTLIMWGKDDGIIPIENGRKLRELIPGSTFVEIENAGHVPHVEYPERVAGVVNEFLKS